MIRDAVDQRVDSGSRDPTGTAQRDGGGAAGNRDRIGHAIGRRRAGGVATQRDGRAIDHNLFVRPVEQTAHREAELLDGLPGFDGAGIGAGEHRHRRRLRAQARRLGKRRAERRRRQRRRVIHRNHRHRGSNELCRGVGAAVGGAAAVLDLRQREGAAARRRIVGVGVLIRDAVDQRVDSGSRDPTGTAQRDGGGAAGNRDV